MPRKDLGGPQLLTSDGLQTLCKQRSEGKGVNVKGMPPKHEVPGKGGKTYWFKALRKSDQ